MLHLLQVNFIVEVDDIFGLTCLLVYYALGVNLSDILFALEKMGVVVDDRVECNLLLVTYLGYRVDCAHDKLIEVSVHQQLWFTA